MQDIVSAEKRYAGGYLYGPEREEGGLQGRVRRRGAARRRQRL